jgi:hypothetical protein
MSEEEIRLQFKVNEDFFAELDRRFEDAAKRGADRFAGALRGAPGSTAGGGGGSAGGTAGGAGGAPGGPGAFASAAALFQGAGQGILATPAAAASSPSVLAQNAGLGAAQAGVNIAGGLARAGGGLVGGAIGGALGGPVGAVAGEAVGQAAGGVLGDLVQAQFNSVKEAMQVPTDRAVGNLKGIFGNLAASGVQVTDEQREQAAAFSLKIERLRYEGERKVERVTREVAARDSLSQGVSWIGR